jgi:hypothetical protein
VNDCLFVEDIDAAFASSGHDSAAVGAEADIGYAGPTCRFQRKRPA